MMSGRNVNLRVIMHVTIRAVVSRSFVEERLLVTKHDLTRDCHDPKFR